MVLRLPYAPRQSTWFGTKMLWSSDLVWTSLCAAGSGAVIRRDLDDVELEPLWLELFEITSVILSRMLPVAPPRSGSEDLSISVTEGLLETGGVPLPNGEPSFVRGILRDRRLRTRLVADLLSS